MSTTTITGPLHAPANQAADPLAAYRIEEEPFYRPSGREVQLYRQAYQHRMPLILKGPTGCGKTRFVEYMAWALKRPLVTLACNEDMTASDLVGRYLLDADGTAWHDGPLTLAVRHGGICYLDEVVEARQDTTVVIHPLTDARRALPLDKKGEVVHAHPDFQLVVSYNPGYQSSAKDMSNGDEPIRRLVIGETVFCDGCFFQQRYGLVIRSACIGDTRLRHHHCDGKHVFGRVQAGTVIGTSRLGQLLQFSKLGLGSGNAPLRGQSCCPRVVVAGGESAKLRVRGGFGKDLVPHPKPGHARVEFAYRPIEARHLKQRMVRCDRT